ncbi:MAG TPA: efflux RND transporter permease subunit [Thermoanaerobaculia bacterium]
MRRHVAAFAVIVFALVSAPAIHLDYVPGLAQPEVTVALEMGAGTDPEELTARWVVPIESAIRSLGDVIATRGEITAGDATITVRFRRGTDTELKTARLASELAGLRGRLPRDARLSVWPSQQSGARPSAFLAVPRAADAKRIADELRGVTGVRDVRVFGGTEIETVIETERADAEELREQIASAATPHPLGRNVFGIAPAPPVAGYQRFSEPMMLSRLNGKPVVMLAVIRDPDVSLFRFDAALRDRNLGEEIWSEARELRALLLRLAAGALVATLLLALRGAALYVPLSIALAINVARITGAHVDAWTLLAAAIAIAAVAPFAILGRRPLWPILFFAILPIATSYLAPQLTHHALAFTAAATCALVAVPRVPRVPRSSSEWLVWPPRGTRGTRGAPRNRGTLPARLQRNSFSVALTATAIAILLLSWFAPVLDPRKTANIADRGRLYIHTTLPTGTTLASTTSAVATLEAALKNEKDVTRFWSILGPGYATTIVEIEEERKQLLRLSVPALARGVPGSVTASESYSRASEDLEDKPEADESGTVYRVLLKSTDAGTLRRMYEELANRLARMNVRRAAVVPEWDASTARIELVPRPHVTFDEATRAAAQLAERTIPPRARMLPDGRLLRILTPRAPASIDAAPQRADVPIPALFVARNAIVPGRVTRELGRYVLPVTVQVPGWNEEETVKKRGEIDRTLATLSLPPGVMLERPSLARWTFSKEKIRVLSLAAFLPLLLIAAACVVLSSFPRALVACAPAILGIAVAAPLLLLARVQTGEITIVALAAAVCGTMPIAVAARTTYRDLRETLAPLLLAAVAGTALLAIAATEDLRGPLLGAAAVLLIANATGTLLPTTILVAARDAKRRMKKPTSGRAFRSSSVPLDDSTTRSLDSLSVRHLTKTYGAFRALHDVSFELTPGVIGLLGPNGAGKTTLLRTLTGLLTPTRGQVLFRGVAIDAENLAEYRRHIGFLPQEFNAYSGLTGAQFLRYWMLERGVDEDVHHLLQLVGLEAHADRRVRDYSGGMRQRIGIARALIGDPPILVVDEPTTGLDVESRAAFRELMQSLAKDRIIIVSTHIASDVESTASRILLLVRGRLRWDGTPDALIAAARGRVFETTVSDADARKLSRAYRVTKRVRTQHGIRLRGVARADEPLPGSPVEPTLEEAYLAIASEGEVRLGSFSFLAQ